jgi:hypothetical protein
MQSLESPAALTMLTACAVFALMLPVSTTDAQSAFDLRDLAGHWVLVSPATSVRAAFNADDEAPPLTAEGRAMLERNRPGYGPRRALFRNDPIGRCYPLGLLRNLNAEIIEPHNLWEIVMTGPRILQFFEYRHDWRETWMDGGRCRRSRKPGRMTITDPVVYARPWQSDRKLFRLDRERAGEFAEQIYCIAEEEQGRRFRS